MLFHDIGIGFGKRRRIVVITIGNTKAAAEIDMLDGMAIGAQHSDQFGQKSKGIVKRLQRGDLAAEMHVDADRRDIFQFRGPGIDVAGALPGNTELVFGPAGGNFLVRACIDIGVDAKRDWRNLAGRPCAGVEKFQFGFGLHIEAVDAGRQRMIHFPGALADAGKHDALRRNAGSKCAAKLAFGNNIGATAEIGQDF